MGAAGIAYLCDSIVVRSTCVSDIARGACCVLRRNKFRFGHAVQAIEGLLTGIW